jgi:hypothetical protein
MKRSAPGGDPRVIPAVYAVVKGLAISPRLAPYLQQT